VKLVVRIVKSSVNLSRGPRDVVQNCGKVCSSGDQRCTQLQDRVGEYLQEVSRRYSTAGRRHGELACGTGVVFVVHIFALPKADFKVRESGGGDGSRKTRATRVKSNSGQADDGEGVGTSEGFDCCRRTDVWVESSSEDS